MITNRFGRIILLSWMAVLTIIACDKWDFDRIAFTQVITVGALEVGFSSAFLLGDIEGLRNAQIIETGFVYSSTTDGDESLRLGQGDIEVVISPHREDSTITEDRAFAARASDLNPSTKHFFRAYIRLEGDETAYGEIDTFVTTSLNISAPVVTRNFSGCSGTITITVNLGGRSAPDNSFGIIWSDDRTNMYPTLSSGMQEKTSEIDQAGNIVIQLPVECNTVYFIRGFYQTSEAEVYGPIYSFTTTTKGTWISAGDFPIGFDRDLCFFYFSNDAHGYVAHLNESGTETQFWKFDPITLDWKPLIYPGLGIFCFSDLASTTHIVNHYDGVEYDPNRDQWTVWMENRQWGKFGFNFEFNNQVYFNGGIGWDPENRIWKEPLDRSFERTVIGVFLGELRKTPRYFIIDKKGYVGLGTDITGAALMDFWEFDFLSEDFSPLMSFPKEIFSEANSQGPDGPTLSMNGKGYILTGYDKNGNPVPDFYEYDPNVDQWTKLADFGSGDSNADVGFVIDGIAYGGLGISTNGEVRNEFWRYVSELKMIE